MQTAITEESIADTFEKTGRTEMTSRIFETLSNPRRRELLRYLLSRRSDETVVVRTLAEEIAAWENGISIPEVTYKQRKRVYTSLYQAHLPKLHEYGFIDYDSDRGTVKVTEKARSIDVYLETVPEGEIPWSEVYLGTSMTTAAFAAALWFGAVPMVTGWHAFVACVVIFVGLSIAHTVEKRRNIL